MKIKIGERVTLIDGQPLGATGKVTRIAEFIDPKKIGIDRSSWRVTFVLEEGIGKYKEGEEMTRPARCAVTWERESPPTLDDILYTRRTNR